MYDGYITVKKFETNKTDNSGPILKDRSRELPMLFCKYSHNYTHKVYIFRRTDHTFTLDFNVKHNVEYEINLIGKNHCTIGPAIRYLPNLTALHALLSLPFTKLTVRQLCLRKP